MNIFYTNPIPKYCAREHCATHVNKMIVEYAQLMSTAQQLLGNPSEDVYAVTHANHPSCKWVMASTRHYMWLFKCWQELLLMYKRKSGKDHASSVLRKHLLQPPPKLSNNGFVPPYPACGEYINNLVTSGDLSVRDAYRMYLNNKFKEWAVRTDKRQIFVNWYYDTPSWYTN